MSLSVPAATPRALPRLYHGWWVLLVAAAAMVGTLPGRTQGLGLITEPLLADLGIERVAYAHLNLWATLIGALFALGIGRLMDRMGGRATLTGVAVALGLVVCALSRVHSFAGLAVAVTLTRGLGQSALSVVSLALVGQWFVRRIDRAMALYSVVLSVGFMLAFPLVGTWVEHRGWRQAWLLLGLALVAGLAPLAAWLVRRGPEELGLEPDGAPGVRHPDGAVRANAPELPGHSLRAAASTPAFWVFALGTALYGLVASGIGLFNESILAERGFGAEVYHSSLAVTALTSLLGNFLGGALAGRLSMTRLLALALAVLALGSSSLPLVTSRTHVFLWASAMGIGGGIVMVLFFSVWPRAFGRRALGRIQGSAQAITVLASAVGPLLLAWCVETTGSYRAMFLALAGVIALLAAAALFVRLPPGTARLQPGTPGSSGASGEGG
jgi:MFS family permease